MAKPLRTSSQSGDQGSRSRDRSLANLIPGGLEGGVTSTSWAPGASPHLAHGERTRRPQRSPEWPPAVSEAIRDLETRVGDELRGENGELHQWALPSVEAVAILRVAAWRCERHVADLEAKGRLTGEEVERSSRVAERYHRALEREALTLRSRLEARGQTFDLARHWMGQDGA